MTQKSTLYSAVLLIVAGCLMMTGCGSQSASSPVIPSPNVPSPVITTPVLPGPVTTTSVPSTPAVITTVTVTTTMLTEALAPSEAPAAVMNGNTSGGQDYAATTEYINAVIKHLDIVWTNWFTSIGQPEPWVNFNVIQKGETVTSKCTVEGKTTFGYDFHNAFYCQLDQNDHDRGVLVLPVATFAKMWGGDIFDRQVSNEQRVGDFAAAALLAHEFGHHIQDELSEDFGVAAPPSPQVELIADCFSGVWAHAVDLDQYLEEGDIIEAINALGVIGDTEGSHGTDAERQNAFMIGFSGSKANPTPGVPVNCIAAYWKAFPLTTS